MNVSEVTRLEVVDHSVCDECGAALDICRKCGGMGFEGRSVIFWDKNKKIELSLQDDKQTLKIFISDRDD